MKTAICRFILRIFGWKIEGWDPNLLDKYVTIVIPHTSNWDFPLGLLVRQAMNAPHLKFIGKNSLFRPPFGALFRWLGGYPVDRTQRTNFVDSIVDLYNKNDRFVVVLSPEGTRKKVDHLRTGFYYIAQGAGVPIVMVKFDWQHKRVTWNEPYYPVGNWETDLLVIENYYRGVQGKIPENSYMYKR
ncbi:MAG: 1-acyl-sn-glycerol-3-phosphate acyltransferase [Saprospirales bacterium]|nr:1-acyl-sn-glycerol-3-phosphate acyltransferase [Saprospirales bacterium]MBK8490122.1 1-acyl-sn-glycerol-3-phosphate acyltransferase [Saprospirales bacterium]